MILGTRILLNMKDMDENDAIQLTTNIDHNFVLVKHKSHITIHTNNIYIINYQDSCIQFNHINVIHTFIFTTHGYYSYGYHGFT